MNYNLVFAAVTYMTSANVIFALAHLCGMSSSHGGVSNAYVKAATGEGFGILLFVPDGMKVSTDQLDKLGVNDLGLASSFLGM